MTSCFNFKDKYAGLPKYNVRFIITIVHQRVLIIIIGIFCQEVTKSPESL